MNTIEETIEEKEMSEDNMVEHPYEPYLVKAPCWIGNGQIKYDYVPASFARHPCDLFDKNRNREEWKYLNEEEKSIETVLKDKNVKEKLIEEHFKNLLPEKAEYLRKHIAGGIQVSSFGRVGIPIKCKGESGFCKGCKGCKLNCDSEKKVYLRKKLVKKCENFHFILSQYESLFWNNSQQKFETYNGYLVVNINGEERLVYELVAQAFELKKAAFQKMKKFMEKKKLDFGDENELKDAFNNEKLQIHHINNNGHHNTPWNGEDGNLIALPESVHKEIHKIKNPS